MPDPVPGVRLREILSEDAVGTIGRCVDAATGETLSVRRLHGHLAGDEAARLVFAEEVRRIATLDHPGLLKVRRHDVRGAYPWMLTDPADGETLEGALAKGAWPAAECRTFALHMLGALALLERRKQFHAAPIPRRIVRAGGTWRLVTFRDIRAEDEAARLKGRAADPAWAAPEMDASHPGVPAARSLTSWAAGALWMGVLTGRPPDAGGGAFAQSAAAGADARILANMLDPVAVRRPPGAAACITLFQAAADAPSPSGPPISGAPHPAAPPPIAPLKVKRRLREG